eukprot:12704426-Prorocentrum_lima.AAC.1
MNLFQRKGDPLLLCRRLFRCLLFESDFNSWLLSTDPYSMADLRSSFAGVLVRFWRIRNFVIFLISFESSLNP